MLRAASQPPWFEAPVSVQIAREEFVLTRVYAALDARDTVLTTFPRIPDLDS